MQKLLLFTHRGPYNTVYGWKGQMSRFNARCLPIMNRHVNGWCTLTLSMNKSNIVSDEMVLK